MLLIKADTRGGMILPLVYCLKNLLRDVKQLVIYADLLNCRAEENPPITVPPAIVCTSSRPDIVVVESSQVVSLIELTVPFNSPEALEYARRFKTNKENYQLLLSDLDSNGYQSELITIEIGALGHWLPRSLSAIRSVSISGKGRCEAVIR